MKTPILFVNACVRRESRTRRLAEKLLLALGEPWEEVRLEAVGLPEVDEAFLAERDRLAAAGAFGDPVFALARQFAAAGTVVIAAPYWDLSFPAALKRYLEQVNAVGVTFRYGEDGVPVGLCRAERLYYVTTAGGTYVPDAFGFGYVEALARGFYGIRDVRKIEAAGLDVDGADAGAILRAAEAGVADAARD